MRESEGRAAARNALYRAEQAEHAVEVCPQVISRDLGTDATILRLESYTVEVFQIKLFMLVVQ